MQREASYRLLSRTVLTSNGCWMWTAAKAGRGYGVLRFRGRQWYAHRVSWVVYRGEIPQNICVLHRCDTPGCINPEHLFLGSYQDNSRDASCKGRLPGNRTHGSQKPIAKLDETSVRRIRLLYYGGASIRAIQRQYHPALTWEGIKAAAIGKTWRHVNFDEERTATR